MNRVLGCIGGLIVAAVLVVFLVIGIGLLRATAAPGTPDCSAAEPCPSVTPYPGGWKP